MKSTKAALHAPMSAVTTTLETIRKNVIHCSHCPRLREYCTEIARVKRKSYLQDNYWGKPIPGFGTKEAQLVILGLAPAAHGANRTGRIFTGDRSGDWLYRALFKAGFANQPEAHNIHDGLLLKNCYITCAVKCAPPDNKPTPTELKACTEIHLNREIETLTNARVYVALGQIAFHAFWSNLSGRLATVEKALFSRRPDFKHGAKISLPGNQWLILSYHPSQQNTFTGRLTEKMFDEVFDLANESIERTGSSPHYL